MEIEFGRLVLSFIVGYFLCLSGSLSQLVTNNPLGSPSTLGMDGLAVFFVLFTQSILIFFDLDYPLSIISFIFFSIGFIPFIFMKREKKKSIWTSANLKHIILMGIAFNLFIGAIFSIMQFLFMAYNFEFPTELWFGNFKIYKNYELPILLMILIPIFLYLFKNAEKLNILNLGHSFARGQNVDVEKIQRVLLLISLYVTGVIICFYGVFSFLGLIFPHILRDFKAFRFNMKNEVLYGPFFAGLLMSILDQIVYYFPVNGAELPVGMISSVLGAIFLIFLLFKSRLRVV